MHPNILRLGETAFLIIDVQEAFRNSIVQSSEIIRRIIVFARAAELLKVPVVVTEQYPKGLGKTVHEIAEVLPDKTEIIEKTTFSSCGARQFVEKLERIGARQIVVAGIEAHVCVNQTVHDLLENGFQVHLLADCISSRHAENMGIALAKMQQSGAILSSVEMALFELMRDSKHEQFKAVQKLIK
jgi:nicotinamidase-related amidase